MKRTQTAAQNPKKNVNASRALNNQQDKTSPNSFQVHIPLHIDRLIEPQYPIRFQDSIDTFWHAERPSRKIPLR